MKTSVSLDKAIAVSRLLRDKEVDTLRTQRVAYLVQCMSFESMDQGQRDPFC